ncbi:hypothetical protein [Streptomyces sp. NBC_00280]|uniref:hypothetical protein n=1 Tax=Streptomyces sp. NBC_00280 TaxID=2975699 RepID=UPI00324B5ACF
MLQPFTAYLTVEPACAVQPRGTPKLSEDEQLLDVRLTSPSIARACDLAWTFHDHLLGQTAGDSASN